MATKYTRGTDLPAEREIRRTPWMRQRPGIRRLSRRQSFFVILFSLTALALLAQMAIRLGLKSPYQSRAVRRGVGTVIARGAHRAAPDGEGGSGTVTIEIVLEDDVPYHVDWSIPDPYWDALPVGSRVAVLYQVNHTRSEIRLVECGLVALPDDIG